MGGSNLDASQVEVRAMEDMSRIFNVEGPGSTADIRQSTIISNVILGQRWIGVRVEDRGRATVSRTTFTGNSGSEHLILANLQSSATANQLTVDTNNGAKGIVSTLARRWYEISTGGLTYTHAESKRLKYGCVLHQRFESRCFAGRDLQPH